MKLFICEKPSQAKDIAANLGITNRNEHAIEGNGMVVTWCIGHLLELSPPDYYCENIKPWRMEILPISPQKWVMQSCAKTQKQLNAIGKLLKKATSVVIATDADREGDVIGREVLEYFGYQGHVERLWLSALDDASIQKALANIKPGSATENLYQAGLGRQRADWLMGMNLTIATSALFGVYGQGVLSVGRVQTPTLKLVVDRDKTIEAFQPKDYFELKACFKTQEGSLFHALWEVPEDMADEEGRCVNKKTIEEVAKAIERKTATVADFQQTPKKVSPPLCLSLSSLQKLASSQFGFSAKETLEIAQSLYEKHKATTYPRTDCAYLPESQFKEAKQVLHAVAAIDKSMAQLIDTCDMNKKSSVWNDKKITAHHGIIPTMNTQVNLSAMSDKEFKLYDVIRRHYIVQFLEDFCYMQRAARVLCEGFHFKASENRPTQIGWKVAIKEEKDEASTFEQKLLVLKIDETLHLESSHIESKKTQPPSRFTEGSLITAMKSIAKYVQEPRLKKILKDTAGIGTEATRANILETLINREYLHRKGKQLISTAKGRGLIDLLPESITNPATTALWEQKLDEIAEGKAEVGDFLDDQKDVLEGMLKQLASLGSRKNVIASTDNSFNCPDCQKPMVRRKGKKGFWWGCSGYPTCTTTAFDNKGKPNFSFKETQEKQCKVPFSTTKERKPFNLVRKLS